MVRGPYHKVRVWLLILLCGGRFTWKDTIAKGCPTWTETQEHENLAKELWENQKYQDGWESPSHPNGGQYSRTDTYNGKHYNGENALHLAIVKRRGDLVHYFLSRASEQERKKLLECHATGKFPIDYIRVEMADGVHRGCVYGETPLCWAACTTQKEIFEYLVQCGANINCSVNKTGDTILHMLVRLTQEAPRDSEGGDHPGAALCPPARTHSDAQN